MWYLWSSAPSLLNTVMMAHLILMMQRTVPIEHGNDVSFDSYDTAHCPYWTQHWCLIWFLQSSTPSLQNTVMMSHMILMIQCTIPTEHSNDVSFDSYDPAQSPIEHSKDVSFDSYDPAHCPYWTYTIHYTTEMCHLMVQYIIQQWCATLQ